MSKKTLSIGASILGILFVALAVMYWMVPAGSLPTFLPGHIDGSSVIHLKHGLASLILGLLLFAYAWFASGSKGESTPNVRQ